MRRKGFTLIEVLGVLIILGILSLITVPMVTSYIDVSKEKAYEQSIKGIIDAAKYYVSSEDITSDHLQIQVKELKEKGYLDKVVTNPRNGNNFPPDTIGVPSSSVLLSHFVATNNVAGEVGFYHQSSNGALHFTFPDRLVSDLPTLRTWLGKNHVTFLYPLKTETIEEISYQEVKPLLGDNTNIKIISEPHPNIHLDYIG